MQSSQDRTGTRRTLDLAQRLGADRHLQAEIDQAMADLVETSPSSLGHNLARVLCAILEPAWAEHTSFQDDALFPILARTGAATADTHELLDRLGREHEEIGARQVEV